jgi:cellulose synthase/poly-beta-1,6-N-acetylglucosamine synthase-like glycosyltransferase
MLIARKCRLRLNSKPSAEGKNSVAATSLNSDEDTVVRTLLSLTPKDFQRRSDVIPSRHNHIFLIV